MSATNGDAAAPARILIVDDERRNRDLLEVMLGPEGYVLSTAVSGDEALVAVAAQRPDLILLDVMMPGLDGYQVATRIKSDPATADIRILLLTSLSDQNSKAHGMRAGVEDVLAKPVNRTQLCERVKAVLREPAARST
jgi:CheY-like chemotaxis protein